VVDRKMLLYPSSRLVIGVSAYELMCLFQTPRPESITHFLLKPVYRAVSPISLSLSPSVSRSCFKPQLQSAPRNVHCVAYSVDDIAKLASRNF